MRLIDADKLLLELELAYDEADAKYHETDFDSFYGGCCSMIQEAIKEVEKQPTAYDVDKVVEQLEKKIQTHKRVVEYESKNGTITEEFQQRKAVEVLESAIEIVKTGGKEQ